MDSSSVLVQLRMPKTLLLYRPGTWQILKKGKNNDKKTKESKSTAVKTSKNDQNKPSFEKEEEVKRLLSDLIIIHSWTQAYKKYNALYNGPTSVMP